MCVHVYLHALYISLVLKVVFWTVYHNCMNWTGLVDLLKSCMCKHVTRCELQRCGLIRVIPGLDLSKIETLLCSAIDTLVLN